MKCHRGCGLVAKETNYKGLPCCSKKASSCPSVKAKIGRASKKFLTGKTYEEIHGKSANAMRKLRSDKLRGRPITPETVRKIKQSNIAHWSRQKRTPWNKGKTGVQTAWNKGHKKQELPAILNRKDPAYSDFKKYRNRVAYRTKKTYELFKMEINPNNLKLGVAGKTGAHHIDHIISVREGFVRNLPIEIISAKDNLQILPWLDNIRKYDGSRS